MKRSLLAGLCLAVAACATEPREQSFDGTITAVFKVIDVFQAQTDYTLTVDQDPAHTDLNDPCSDEAKVHLAPTATIVRSGALGVQVSPDELVPFKEVRVEPALLTGTGCSRRIEATSIVIVR